MIEVKIGKNDQNKRLDKFVLKYLSSAPSSLIYKLFRKKDIKINGKPEKPEYITKLNDAVKIFITKDQEKDFLIKKEVKVSKKKEFSVIYEDENILIVNKPAGLLVHDGDKKSESFDTLTKQVLNYLIESGFYNPEFENSFTPALAHRIDRNTSGLVVFGKTSLALQELFDAFKDHEGMEKVYETLVAGKVMKPGKIDVKLAKNEKTKMVNIDEKHGLRAITLYKPIKKYKESTHLCVIILTGRTHQIRVHMKYEGYPIVGDTKYGSKESDLLAKLYKMDKYFLHSKSICFHNLKGSLHYLNGKKFIAPYYEWERKLLKRLL